MTLEELRIVISAQTEPLRQELAQVRQQLNSVQSQTNRTTSVMMGAFKKLVAGVVALKIGQKIGESIINGVKDAMNVEAAIQQIKRIMGESSNQFLKWADTQAIAFNMSKSEAVKYGSVFGNLISGFTGSTKEITARTESLLKASSVIASATGRSMEDVMERIRSGLLGNTESIEDLGVNVNIAMIQSTDAFKKFANGKSWDQLSFQTQQQIRLFAILEQTTKKYGDSVNENTATSTQQFVAQLKNLRLSLGEAFLPVYQIIIPALSQMVQYLSYAMNTVAQFSQALFGKHKKSDSNTKSTQQQTQAVSDLGNAYQKAGKQAQGALAGFDEINQLSLNDGSGDGATDGTPPLDPLNKDKGNDKDKGIAKDIEEMADRVRKALEPIGKYITETGDLFVDFWNNIQPCLQPIVDFLENIFTPVWEGIKSTVANTFEATKNTIAGALQIIQGIIEVFSALLTGDWDLLWKGIKDIFLGIWKIIITQIEYFATQFKIIWDGLVSILKVVWETVWNAISIFATTAWNGIKDTASVIWNSISNLLKDIWNGIKDVATITWNAIKDVIYTVWKWLSDNVGSVFNNIRDAVSGSFNEIQSVTSMVWNAVSDTISNVWNWISSNVSNVFDGTKNVITGSWNAIKSSTIDIWIAVYNKIKSVWDWLSSNVGTVFNGVRDTIIEAFETVGKAVTRIWDGITNTIKTSINFIITAINKFIDAVNSLRIDIPEVRVPGTDIHLGGGSIGFPHINNIPALARGGIVDSPTLAMIGEAGKEAVVPLENTSFVNTLASAVGSAVLAAMQFTSGNNSSDNPGDIYLQIDGTTFARLILPYSQTEASRIGKSVILKTS